VTLAGWTYGGTASTPSVTGNTGNGEVTYAYKAKNADDSTYSSDVPTAVGEYTVKATVAASTSYNEGTATADFTISKANSTVSEHTAKTLTYNGEAQELVNVGSATGGTLYYAVTTENEAPDASAYTTSIPTATNAGTYYVWYSVTGNTNYNDIAPASVTVTIDKAEPTLPTGLSTTGISTTDSSTTDLSTTGLSATVGQTLADIALPEGFAWVDATKSVGNEGTNLFEAVYTPADTTNYVTKTVTLGVTVTAETTTEEETTDNDTSSAVTGEGNIPIVVIFAIFGCLALVLVGKKYYE
ncbi:MAG: hypothetical protein K6F92_09530, partial [Lachnospiraceae bacterium]|nr:hypothetical protein [Lachnospiraceae bacterium]